MERHVLKQLVVLFQHLEHTCVNTETTERTLIENYRSLLIQRRVGLEEFQRQQRLLFYL